MSTLSRHRHPARLLAVAAVAAAAVAAQALPASAAPQSSYPRPVRAYVWHPAGFNDSGTVYVTKGKNGALVPHCERVPLATARSGDVTVSVRKELAPLFAELMRQTETKYGYNLVPGITGAFNCRMITGSSNVSNHAYGRAIDINWTRNPMQSTFKSDIPPAVVKLWIDHGFYWGGHYTNKKDTMHFEYVAPLSAAPTYLKQLKAGR